MFPRPSLVVAAGLWQFVVSTGQILQPLVLRALVVAVSAEDPAAARARGLRVVAMIFALVTVAMFAQQRQLPTIAQTETRHLLGFIDEMETLGIVLGILQRLLGQAVLTVPALGPLPYLVRESKEVLTLALSHQLPLQRGQFFVMAGLTAQRCTQIAGGKHAENAWVLAILIQEGDLPLHHRAKIHLLDAFQIAAPRSLGHADDMLAHHGKSLFGARAVLQAAGQGFG